MSATTARRIFLTTQSDTWGAGQAASTPLLLQTHKQERLIRVRVKRNRKIVAGAAVVGLIAAGAAYAFWTAGGAGTGTAAAAADGAPLVIVQTSPITGLTPGGTAKPLSGNINNPNQFAVPVAGITAVVSGVVPATCTVDNFAITGYGDATPVAGIPSGTAQGSWSGLAIQLVNKVGVNQDICKGAAITVAYTITNTPAPPAIGTVTRTADSFTIRLAGPNAMMLEGSPYTIVTGDTLKVAVEGGSYQQSVVLATAGANGELLFQGVPQPAGVAIYPLPAGALYYNVYVFHGTTAHVLVQHIL